ncbi:MAG: hypothetical protein ACF787_13415 [Rhodopirellula sp. JB053]
MLQLNGFSIAASFAVIIPVLCPVGLTARTSADWPIVENAPASIQHVSYDAGSSLSAYPPLPEGAVLLNSSVHSFDSIDRVAGLLDTIDRARDALDPDRLPNLEKAEAAVIEAMAGIESYLERSTNDSNRSAWLSYLTLEPLSDSISNGESVSKRGRAAVELESRLRGLHVGLELEPMVRLRRNLQTYIAALRYSDPKRGLQSVEKQLDAIAELFVVKDETPKRARDRGDESSWEATSTATTQRRLDELSAEEIARLERLLIGLSDANQASAVTSQIRSYFSKPNLRGWVDGRAITDALSRPVNNPNEVNDCILGTRLLGNASIVGNVTAQLLPSEGHVRLMVRMDAAFSSNTRGYRKPITLDSNANGHVYAARQLAITERRIVLGATVGTADLSSRVKRINHPLKLVRKIAMRKANEQRPLAEAISENKLRDQTIREFEMQTATAAEREFPSIDEAINPWLRRLDLPGLTRTIGSTTDAFYSRANLQRDTGLAALVEPPSRSAIRSATGQGIHPGGYFSAIQVHQSVLDNTITDLLSGQTMSPEKINELVGALGIALPKPIPAPPEVTAAIIETSVGVDLDVDQLSLDTVLDTVAEVADNEPAPSEEDFEVDLHSFRPVFVEADNQTLRIGLRGTRFAQGDREIKRTLEVAATYRPVIGEDSTMWLIRDDEVDLSFPGTRRLTISQTAIKTNMEKSFNDLFPNELLHRSFPLPETIKLPALAGRELKVHAIDLTNGWISIAVR